MVREQLEAGERPLPRFCAREIDAFLRCGVLAYVFARVWCQACGRDDVGGGVRVGFGWAGPQFEPPAPLWLLAKVARGFLVAAAAGYCASMKIRLMCGALALAFFAGCSQQSGG